MDYSELNSVDKDRLNRFLSKCERHLGHIDLTNRNIVIEAIKKSLLERREQSEFAPIFLTYTDTVSYVNSFLVPLGLPLAKKKKRNFLLYLILAFLFFIALIVFLVFQGVKSFLNDVELTEDHFSMMNGKVTITSSKNFNNTPKKVATKSPKISNMSGDSVKKYSKISITAENSVVKVISTGQTFKYDCKSDDTTYLPLAEVGKELLFSLKGKNECTLIIPVETELDLNFKNVVVTLEGMQQNFNIDLENGVLNWRGSSKSNYSLRSEVTGVTIDTSKFSENGKYKATLKAQGAVVKF